MGTQLRNNPQLRAAFEDFALFGAPRVVVPAHGPSQKEFVSMDSAKFAKLCRDSGLIDNASLSLIDVDIIFSKCKEKGKRRLDYLHFQKALVEIARTRQCDVDHVVAMIVTAAPEINGTIPQVDEIIEKLTDTSLYTGTHKARFDPVTGQGLGLSGRETISPTANLSAIVSRANSAKTLGSPSKMARTTSHSSSLTSRSDSVEMPAVFERLNSSSSFTGTQKHKFSEDGKPTRDWK